MPNKNPIFVAFDLETTGFDPECDAIIEIGILKFSFSNQGDFIKLAEYSQLINPQRELPLVSSLITGIKPQELINQPTIAQAVSSFAEIFKEADFIVGHNVNFDISFLSKHINLAMPTLDSQNLAEIFLPGFASYSLDVLPFELGIARAAGHRAFEDSQVSVEVLLKSLKRFLALSPTRQEQIIRLFKNIDQSTVALLEKLPAFLKPENCGGAQNPEKTDPLPVPNLKKLEKAILQQMDRGGKCIITHTAQPHIALSVMPNLKKLPEYSLIISRTPEMAKAAAKANLFLYEDPICLKRIQKAAQAKTMPKFEAMLLVKILVAAELDAEFKCWPKFGQEERQYLKKYLLSEKICSRHKCAIYLKRQAVFNNKKTLSLTYRNFWQIPQKLLSKRKHVLIFDFDDFVENLSQNLEIRLNNQSLAELLNLIELPKVSSKRDRLDAPLPFATGMPEANDANQLKKEISKLSDLFWERFRQTFAERLENKMSAPLWPADLCNQEYQSIWQTAHKLSSALQKLVLCLQKEKDECLLALAEQLKNYSSQWQTFNERSENYSYVIEENQNLINVKLTALSKILVDRFLKLGLKNITTTASIDSQNLTEHYVNLLSLHDWEIKRISLPINKNASLKIVTGASQPMEKALTILMSRPQGRALVVAKNTTEAKLCFEHFARALGDTRKVLAPDKLGGGVLKTVYKFNQEKNAIMIAPPRGKILNTPWPELELAVVTTIPFPPPQAGLKFMDSSFPKAMLAQKNLLAKILRSSRGQLDIYLLDARLTGQSYGRDFIALAEELCGAKAEFLTA